ncbi:MAG: hypothetical protein WCG99_00060 [Candidatus Berkelbacteria bacterium]
MSEKHQSENLVNIADFGIKGANYYWTRSERYKISKDELENAGVFDGNAYLDKKLIAPLQKANEKLLNLGMELIVKDAHRTPELYKLAETKLYEYQGKDKTDKLLNMIRMPHATGLAVDIGLIDLKTGEELKMRDSKDDPEAYLIDNYRKKKDPQSKEFQRLQDILIETMTLVGFSVGTKGEFWHFEWKK